MNPKIAFLGAGRMASAIVKGLIKKDCYKPQAIVCTCGDDPTGPELAAATGIGYIQNLETVIKDIEVLVLACKPQQLSELNPNLFKDSPNLTILSILAGTPIAKIKAQFPNCKNIIRSMPNTPGQISAGVTAYASENSMDESASNLIESILGALGSVYSVPESQLDAVTAVSGSGPAYVFEFIAALSQAGVQAGLEPSLAAALATKTVWGSAELVKQSGQSPESLRDAVTSPGGTTEAALNSLKSADFRALIQQAVSKAKARSIELAGS